MAPNVLKVPATWLVFGLPFGREGLNGLTLVVCFNPTSSAFFLVQETLFQFLTWHRGTNQNCQPTNNSEMRQNHAIPETFRSNRYIKSLQEWSAAPEDVTLELAWMGCTTCVPEMRACSPGQFCRCSAGACFVGNLSLLN